ncbi:hypothetical protein COT42_08905 [Candidatus Saganbacteria bacterium CG08_land_8_20_14_0_20_45_16]|uniref:DUF3084 domain-containing protein n=1 Tax=Candidatus Saganbacteria bacterium CG08_land_8_20_14_0_20_45_16 TaxID=2014293 RepID=A0A2H0XTB5_UNCSA|nr:MAG: hypothetical protein COT42_08905 [Candidatus Saganbacteria bacterium CG08_land_8_20_14_0_20_45_16]
MISGIILIIGMLVLAGIVAIVGDYIGRSIGRRRLTLLKLRPRHTAIIFTTGTGVLIALVTIVVLLLVSSDVRTALFGLEELKGELKAKTLQLDQTKEELSLKTEERESLEQGLQAVRQTLTQETQNLKSARQEIMGLQKTKNKLEAQITSARQGQVLFKINETLLISTIQAGSDKTHLTTALKQVLSATDSQVRSFGVKKEGHLVYISPEDFTFAVETLTNGQGEFIVSVVATRNTLFGEQVTIKFNLAKNRLIYKDQEMLAQTTIRHGLATAQIEQAIKELLANTHQIAKAAGVVPDPSGLIGSLPYAEIFNLAKKIKAANKDVVLKTMTKKEVYALGPLAIDFKINYQ